MPNPSEPLDAALVRALLSGTRFADLRYVARTGSTNADALALLGDTEALGTTIVAEHQTAGVGRKGRHWFAPPGAALLFTTILPGSIAAETLWAVPFWIALCIADAVEECCAIALELVWPNDLYARGGKTGGVLSVARIAGDAAWIGCGVGLNVVRPCDDPDLDALQPQPVFLNDLAPRPAREALLAAILRRFDRSFERLRVPATVVARWEQRSQLRGTRYRYRNDADGIERDGIAQRIGAHGALIVQTSDGEQQINMADVRVIGHARDHAAL